VQKFSTRSDHWTRENSKIRNVSIDFEVEQALRTSIYLDSFGFIQEIMAAFKGSQLNLIALIF